MLTKPGRFYARIPWAKKSDIFSPGHPGKKIFDFFFGNNSGQVIIMTFSSPLWGICTFCWGICTFWLEFAHFVENWYILARRNWPWRGKFLNYFSPTSTREDLSWIFSHRGLALPKHFPPWWGLQTKEVVKEWCPIWLRTSTEIFFLQLGTSRPVFRTDR